MWPSLLGHKEELNRLMDCVLYSWIRQYRNNAPCRSIHVYRRSICSRVFVCQGQWPVLSDLLRSWAARQCHPPQPPEPRPGVAQMPITYTQCWPKAIICMAKHSASLIDSIDWWPLGNNSSSSSYNNITIRERARKRETRRVGESVRVCMRALWIMRAIF